jgi:alpha-galactosidase
MRFDTTDSMSSRRLLLFSVLSLLTGLFLLRAQGSFNGVWRVHILRDDGTTEDRFLDLTQQGDTVTGNVIQNYRPREIKGTVSGGKLEAQLNYFAQIVDTYDAVLSGDKLQVTITRIDKPGSPPKILTGVGERSSIEASRAPAPLPIPVLHDVADNGLVRTPPMGWNSWNHFASRVDDAVVRNAADAIVASGMKDAGYDFVNIDDTWEADRDADGNIRTNKKFPDMKALADYVHSKGLKIGIYSSPGPKTCAGYEGSFGHEAQDAKTYASWGIDYLKYDWCSAGQIYKDSDMQAVYQKMGDALAANGRPIVFSLCQYGREDVWKWGAKVSGNLWRTTGDIHDSWNSMEKIGFAQAEIASYAKPGHWNDPDMLEVGNGGMTTEEYRLHMSLWAMLAAPLLAGNDLQKMSPETLAILTNRDVIAVDQDKAAHPAKRIVLDGKTEVWTREMEDQSTIVALFNREPEPKTIKISFSELNVAASTKARDLWTHRDLELSGDTYSAEVPRHGVVMLRIAKS